MRMMQTVAALGTVVFAALGWTALPALAQSQPYTPQYTPPATSTPQQPGATQQQPGTWQQQPGAAQPQHQPGRMSASRFMARVTGEVTSVDHQSGKLTIKTVDGDVNATFPPDAVQNVRQGDQVSVAIGLMDMSSPSASPRTQ